MGFQFKLKLAAVLAVLQGISVGAAYIVSQGDITVTVIWMAISTGVTAGLSYYREIERRTCPPKYARANRAAELRRGER
jgi:hypothetical protein